MASGIAGAFGLAKDGPRQEMLRLTRNHGRGHHGQMMRGRHRDAAGRRETSVTIDKLAASARRAGSMNERRILLRFRASCGLQLCRLHRQLKNGCTLASAETREQHGRAVGEFQGVVMSYFVDPY